MEQKRHRVILLCNPNLHTKATAKVLLGAGVHLVGIVAARERAGIARLRSSIKRTGIGTVLMRALSRMVCSLLNDRHDRRVYERLYDQDEIESAIASACIPIKLCDRYHDQDVLNWIRGLAPDILVVHSGTMVPRPVRELAGLVIGGHPGLTQYFRGGSSSFRAIYQNRPEDVGWTVFYVDKGVDTGDVIAQGRLDLEPGDSFDTLDWRGMLCIAEEQARLIKQLDEGHQIPRRPYGSVNSNTLYWHPTLLEFIQYRLRQQRVR
jgi:folate-dependent phosphoribosylglycinamide formyltransferase PurN